MEPKPRPRFLWLAIVGMLLGGAVTSWITPRFLAWYWDPPVDIGINCRRAVEWAMARLQFAQALGGIVGLVVGFLVWLSRYRSWKNNPAISSPSEPRS